MSMAATTGVAKGRAEDGCMDPSGLSGCRAGGSRGGGLGTGERRRKSLVERGRELWWTDAVAGPFGLIAGARLRVTEVRRTGRRTGLPGRRVTDEVAAATGSAADEVAAKTASASMADEVAAAAASATTVDKAAAMDEAEMATPGALD